MHNQYLYLFLIILIVSQPELIHYLDSNILGKILLVGSVVFFSSLNSMIGYIFLFAIVCILASSQVSTIFKTEGMRSLSYSEIVDPTTIIEPSKNDGNTGDKGDRERMEVLIQRQQTSEKVYDFSPIQLYEPSACEPNLKESYLNYSEVSN